jgi:trimeric autotransporter adhesin
VEASTGSSTADVSALLGMWDALRSRVDDLRLGAAADPIAAQRAHARVAELRARLDDAVRSGGSTVLDPNHRRAIEEAHEAVLQAEERADKRFAGASARQRLVELRQAEQELLATYGLSSFSDYLLSTTLAPANPNVEVEIAQLRRELAESEIAAQQTLAEVREPVSAAETRAELADLRERIVAATGTEPEQLLAQGPAVDRLGAARFDVERALARVGIGADGPVEAAAEAWAGDRLADRERAAEIAAEIASLPASEPTGARFDAEAALDRALAEEERAAAELAELERRAHEAAVAPVVEEVVVTPAAVLPPLPPLPIAVEPQPEPAEAVDIDAIDRSAEEQSELDLLESEIDAALLARTAAASDLELAKRIAEELVDIVAETASAHAVAAGEAERTRVAYEAAAGRRAELVHLALMPPVESAVPELHAIVDDVAERVDVAEDHATIEQERLAAMIDELGAAATTLAAAEEAERLALVDRPSTAVHDLEFFLLSRVASQRAVALAGPAPLVLDDTFAEMTDEDRLRLLDRLERLADSVQVVYLTSDEAVTEWASLLAPAQGALCQPTGLRAA